MQKYSWLPAVIFIFLVGLSAARAQSSENSLVWDKIAAISVEQGIEAIGYVDGYVIQFSSSPNGSFQVLNPETGDMITAGEVGMPLKGCTITSIENTCIVVGEANAHDKTTSVTCLSVVKPDEAAIEIETLELPTLPEALAATAASILDDQLYVSGHANSPDSVARIYHIKISEPQAGWEFLRSTPSEISHITQQVIQAGGEHKNIYIFNKPADDKPFELYQYSPITDQWRKRSDVPSLSTMTVASPLGAHHILVSGAVDNEPTNYIYHTITDSWAPIQSALLSDAIQVVRPTREPLILCNTPEGTILYRVKGANPQPHFYWLDYIALGTYLLLLVGVGMYFSRGERTTDDFFLAGRRIPWWAAALSLMATQVSSIGFIAVPAKTFATDWIYFTGVLSWFIIVPIVTRVYIPFFRKLNVTSAYEYLEARFNVWVRLFAAGVFSLLQIGRMAVVLYLPALVLSVVTGFPIYVCVLIMGVLATAYTAAGGMEAVIWTDVLQAILLLGGAILCVLVAIFESDGGIGGVFSTAMHDGKFQLTNPSWDITTSAIWVILLGSVFSRFAGVTADQSVIQRYLTTTDEKQAARALWGDVAVSIPWAFIVFMMGTALYVFYKSHPAQVTPGIGADAMVPLFVSQQLPMGISGLIIAAIFAAAMSSLDSSIHSVATVAVTDVYRRFRPGSDERGRLLLARILTVLLGVFGTAVALLMASTFVVSVWDVFLEVLGLLAGVLAGLFLLGLFTNRANGPGTMVGALIGAAVLYWVKQHTDIHFFLYSVIGIGVCFLGGYLFSLILPGIRKTDGLTIYNRAEKKIDTDTPSEAASN